MNVKISSYMLIYRPSVRSNAKYCIIPPDIKFVSRPLFCAQHVCSSSNKIPQCFKYQVRFNYVTTTQYLGSLQSFTPEHHCPCTKPPRTRYLIGLSHLNKNKHALNLNNNVQACWGVNYVQTLKITALSCFLLQSYGIGTSQYIGQKVKEILTKPELGIWAYFHPIRFMNHTCLFYIYGKQYLIHIPEHTFYLWSPG